MKKFLLSTLLLLPVSVSAAEPEKGKELNNISSINIDESTPPIYIGTRTAVAVPANANGDVLTTGVSLGVMLDERNSMGLRVIYMDDPPDNPLSEYTPNVGWAWGPVVDWQHYFQPRSGFSFFTQVSLGYVYGTPESETEKNVVLPILEGGFGARISRKTRSGGLIYLSPELGFVPGAMAPYSSISVGYVLPGSK